MTGLTDVRDRTLTMLRSEGSAVIVDVLYDPDDLRAALTALLRQVGGKATIPGRDAAHAALDVKGRPRPQVRATRDAEPPYDVHLELVDEDDEA